MVCPDLLLSNTSTYSAMKAPDPLWPGPSQSLLEAEETPEKMEGHLDASEPAA